ncbi:LrgB-like protein [Cordyceps fumosorosea ARSEF 2679]|uniref:LrgB-like protein n=1 Tax=Cordyceps fumosorosea (strain ARSEF 2679) TaxID=1081104 RepID=A0A167LZU0_CORFA|nr:LrgB-like protein [Cordyceps fumosorosea ARSEF 2679]OAA53734.1 LrgB-like protein [Cordyceps fumosorosea ARSEF 2679]
MRSCLPSLRPRRPQQHQQSHDHHKQYTASIDMESQRRRLVADRRQKMWCGFCGIVVIVVIYLVSELLIWGLSRALTAPKLEFLASILGMLLVFACMMILCASIPRLTEFYERNIRNAVDFINRHMGAAFTIPMVMLTGHYSMDTKTMGLVISAFLLNSLVAWVAAFFVAKYTDIIFVKIFSLVREFTKSADRGDLTLNSSRNTSYSKSWNTLSRRGTASTTSTLVEPTVRQPWIWTWLSPFWPLVASFFVMAAVGLPMAVLLGEPRILDGCALWFIWISCVTSQRAMKQHTKSYAKPPRVLLILATLANPVLFTILLMMAYIRIKAYAIAVGIPDVLAKLSSGTQLYAIWTYGVERVPAPEPNWFGAGDAALSMLGCGFIVWGFKLHECRRQLFSASGLVAVLVSIAAAAGNVFLGAHVGSLIGLARPEALALAARTTTLALAIPAMKNVGGSTSLTVSLMITNGILGQLVYPSFLNGLEESEEKKSNQLERQPSTHSYDSADTAVPVARAKDKQDSTNTVAAGIAIGINGAAMGVAYLYENKSRSAPYATLAMTTYGVVTVVLIAVHPFRDALLSLV